MTVGCSVISDVPVSSPGLKVKERQERRNRKNKGDEGSSWDVGCCPLAQPASADSQESKTLTKLILPTLCHGVGFMMPYFLRTYRQLIVSVKGRVVLLQ